MTTAAVPHKEGTTVGANLLQCRVGDFLILTMKYFRLSITLNSDSPVHPSLPLGTAKTTLCQRAPDDIRFVMPSKAKKNSFLKKI